MKRGSQASVRLVGPDATQVFAFGDLDQFAYADYPYRMHRANGHIVRSLIALFGLLAMVLSGLHAGPVAAHESDEAQWSDVASHGHVHGSHYGGGEDDSNHSPSDLETDPGHHHCPSAAAPQLPQAELNSDLGKQILFAAEVSFLRLGAAAPPLDPPKA